MEKNSVMLLNDIIYRIHTIPDFDEMRKSVLEFLQYLIPCPISAFYLASSKVPYELERPVGSGLGDDHWQLYLDQFQELDYTRWTFAAPTAQAYRETDLLQENVRITTPYYKALYNDSGMHYSAIVTIIHESIFLGVINLFRPKEDGDFTDEEM
ncbi:MAG: GAF domain-containing protein, partial [Lachnospiraceae bacterium]|nr:GAF domain-containing protein [Lachnospiraceae bacterium]